MHTVPTKARKMAAVALVAVVAGCATPEQTCIDCGGMLAVVPSPSSLSLVIGDSASVSLRIGNVPMGQNSVVQWSSDTPTIARADAVPSGQSGVLVRALTPGEGRLLYTVTIGTQRVTGTYPVRVTARP